MLLFQDGGVAQHICRMLSGLSTCIAQVRSVAWREKYRDLLRLHRRRLAPTHEFRRMWPCVSVAGFLYRSQQFELRYDKAHLVVVRSLRCSHTFHLVEVRGIEPLSENRSTGPSPGADDLLHSRRATPLVRLYPLVAS